MTAPADHLVTPAGSSHVGHPSLLAEYSSLREVRRAIDTLEAQGVDGDHLSLVAEPDGLPAPTDRRRSDSRFLRHTVAFLALGVIGGALVGAAFGAVLVGLVLLAWSGLDATGWVFLLLTIWFGAGGAVLGCFYAISRVVGFSESWPLTFDDEPDGSVWLAVFEPVAEPDLFAARTHALQVVPEPSIDVLPESRRGGAGA